MPEPKTVHLGSSVVRCRVTGSGEPLILVHGLGGSSAWWVRNIGDLSRHYTVYTVDLPGFGTMRRFPLTFSVRGAAAWLRSLLDGLALERVSIIGHSMGGLVSAVFAVEYPERLNRLVLAAPAIGLRSSRIATYLKPLAREMLRVQRSFWRTLIWDSIRAGPFTTLHASRDLLRFKIEDELSRIVTPCLLIWGEVDPLVPPELGRELRAKIQGSRLHILQGAGHILMYDHAEQFNKAVLQFLGAGSAIDYPIESSLIPE
jgi:pimeloyl-ACP methyl ester carboxylesterase